jgi:hypothetical protein
LPIRVSRVFAWSTVLVKTAPIAPAISVVFSRISYFPLCGC